MDTKHCLADNRRCPGCHDDDDDDDDEEDDDDDDDDDFQVSNPKIRCVYRPND